MTTLAVTEFRKTVSARLSTVEHAGERIAIERHGKRVAALVSADDLAVLEALEDRIDIAAAKKALKSPRRHSLAKVRADLGF
jgi:PHD/YefM family antitoxin component YafN of YafNO toxin-antitoxin module